MAGGGNGLFVGHCTRKDLWHTPPMRYFASYAIVLAAFAITTPGEACIVLRAPIQQITRGYSEGIISAVALVKIERANYTGRQVSDAHPWWATAKIMQVLRGTYSAKSVQFTRGYGSAACDDGHPLPRTGEKWVVYFSNNPTRGKVVWATYPLKWAAADPNIRQHVGSVR